MRALVLPALALLLLLFVPLGAFAEEPIELENSDHTFVDLEDLTNIVGVVNNRGHEPIGVTMALDVSDSAGANSTLVVEPYGSVIFPGKGAPFKFRCKTT